MQIMIKLSVFTVALTFIVHVGCANNEIDTPLDESLGDTPGQTPTLCEGVGAPMEGCIPCPNGTLRDQSRDTSDPSLGCAAVLCPQDFYVESNTCMTCPLGTTNEGGDDASQNDTTCDPILCNANEFVDAHVCTPCPESTVNEEGDDSSGENTLCELEPEQESERCAANEYVLRNNCVRCAEGFTNNAGDIVGGPPTSCDLNPNHIASNQALIDACRSGTNTRMQSFSTVAGYHFSSRDDFPGYIERLIPPPTDGSPYLVSVPIHTRSEYEIAQIEFEDNVLVAKLYSEDCQTLLEESINGSDIGASFQRSPNGELSNESYTLVLQLPYRIYGPNELRYINDPGISFWVQYRIGLRDGNTCTSGGVRYPSGIGPHMCADTCCNPGYCGDENVNGCETL